MLNEALVADSRSRWNLLVACLPALQAYVRRLVGDGEAAKEILQEMCVRVLSGESPTDRDRFLAWSRGIARHLIALGWRMRRRAQAEVPWEDDLPEEVGRPANDPEGHLDARAALGRIMVDVDGRGFELLVRRYVLEETSTELARALVQTPAALRMRLMRLRSAASARVSKA
jgi:DNA-directed RNA polymerase specialized sigma24 family protein